MHCSEGADSVSWNLALHDITNSAEALPTSVPSILPLSSRVAFCVSPICPISRSTASAAMKQHFGARLGRSYFPLMPWIAANHRKEDVASVCMMIVQNS